MHNQIISSIGMDQETHLAQENSYGNENWVDMSSYHHQTTMADYEGGGYGYMPPITHGLPSESLSRMPPPPPPSQSIHQPQTTHAQLPMLIMPHATWPSQLTNPHSYAQHSVPPVAIPPVTAPLKTKLPAIQTTSQPRKTLTDDDRRRMCQYAKDHPTAKQTDIGMQFGVERSTVSKVLRNREKYLNSAEDRSSSPVKRSKGKTVNVEKALENYVRNAQKTGIPLTIEDLEKKAHLFSTMGSPSPSDDQIKPMSRAVVEKFMLKNGGGRLMRRASETNIPDSIRGSPSLSASQPSSAISPASPSAHPSPSPLSANKSDEEKECMSGFMDFTADGNAYKHSNSQSTTSLSSAFTDGGGSSFSGSALSPTASFNFSPDGNVGTFLDQTRQIPPPGSAASSFQRPRSQTFPTLDLEYMNQQQNNEPLTPKYHVPSTAPTSALESPANEIQASHFSHGMDHAVTSPQLRRSSSNNSLAGRSATTPATTSAVGSSPSSPTQEDARRAADTLLSFIQNAGAFVDQNEYLTVVRLTEKLRIHQAQMAKATAHGMGGLSRIPEGDSEMPNAPPAIKTEQGFAMVKTEQALGV